jgi:hypothetical protein
MPNQNFIKKFLAMVILTTVTLAPFLDSVACDHCHLIFPQGGPSEDCLTIKNQNRTLSLHDFFAYETTTPKNQSEGDNSPCPFCVFNTFGVISNSHFQIQFSSTYLLNQKGFLALLEPIFLKTRPPKS